MSTRLLELLRANPFLSQQALAEQLGLSRSAVAAQLAALTREGRILGRAYVLAQQAPLVCVGGINIDRKLRSLKPLQPGTSNPASLHESAGGVARNVAETLARLGLPVALHSAVGADAQGQVLLQQLEALGVQTGDCLRLADVATGSYTAVLDEGGELLLALAHMDACAALDASYLRRTAPRRAQAALLMLDLNLPPDSIAQLIAEGRPEAAPRVAVAVSAPKMQSLPESLAGLSLLILNRDELAAASGMTLRSATSLNKAWRALQARGLARLLMTDGAAGVWLGEAGAALELQPAPEASVVDVTGAGDALAAGLCAALSRPGIDLSRACRFGQQLAALTLQSADSVSPHLSPALLEFL